ncbi:hypothetical protein FACS1894132_09290 [Clostridia bacterium]|nr:hypothetical protein FACS1894132_09290 [Clostridia bacterium]
MFKKLVSSVLTITAVTAMFTTNLYASNGDGDGSTAPPSMSYEEQLEEFLSNENFSDERKQNAAEKIEAMIAIRDNANSIFTTYSTPYYATKTLSVPLYTQQNNYFCGPATARQILAYTHININAYTAPSQTTIANAIGTTSANGTMWTSLANYVNNNQQTNNYIETVISSNSSVGLSNLQSHISNGLNLYNAPPILHVKLVVGGTSPWEYPTDGHYMNATGIRMNGGTVQFRVNDPYYDFPTRNGTHNEPNGMYWINSTAVYSATIAHPFYSHIIW